MSIRKHETRVLYSCGHKAHVTLYGNSEQQELKRQWCAEAGLCPDCYAEQMKKDRAALVAMRKEQYSLPDLEGSEKQIAWAEKIRNAGIDLLEQVTVVSEEQIIADCPTYVEQAIRERNDAIRRCLAMFADVNEARFYIDNRDRMYSPQWLIRVCKNYEAYCEINAPRLKEEAQRDTTMMPQNLTHDDAAEVSVEFDCVRASYRQKDEDFRTIVKKLRFAWDGERRAWERKCSQFTGDAKERAAELVNALLHAGFAVMCSDDEVRRRAEEADFSPECRRWVVKSKDGGYVIRWDRDDKDFYRAAMDLPGARYRRDEGGIVVPAIRWREVVDFAYIHDFKLSAKAQAIADAARDAEIPSAPAEPVVPEERDKLAEILQSSTEVLEDLID